MENNITIFNNILCTKEPKYYSIEDIIKSIKAGKLKGKIEMLRMLPLENKEGRNKLKGTLPSICFSGRFLERNNNSCIQHSGLVCLDFDHVKDFNKYKETLKNDKYTHLLFTSPSGDGLKCIVKIPPSIEEHKYHCKGLVKYYSSEHLDNFEDIARVCYASYDPDLYYNPNSEIFTDKVYEEKIEQLKTENSKAVSNPEIVFDYLKKWLEKKDTYRDGNKHSFLVRLSSACNRFGLDSEYVINKLIFVYKNKAGFVNDADFIYIVNRVYKTYSKDFNSAFFENETPIGESGEELNEDVFNSDIPAKDVIFVSDIRDEMLKYYDEGLSFGETTHFEKLDEHFKFKRKEVTLISGIGNYGKSTVVSQLQLIKSVKENIKWGIFSPESYPPITFYDNLIHSLTGKNTLKQYTNRISKTDYEKAMDYINEKFFYVYPKNDRPTPEIILNRFKELIYKNKIDGCLIDPFNQLDHDWNKNNRDDLYISTFLSMCSRFAQVHDVYFLIIAHPKGGLVKSNNGHYQCPDVYDLSGGAMWNNKCDNILFVHREERGSTSTLIRSSKIRRQREIGTPGDTTLDFDFKQNRFLSDGVSPLQCSENPFNDLCLNSDKEKVPF